MTGGALDFAEKIGATSERAPNEANIERLRLDERTGGESSDAAVADHRVGVVRGRSHTRFDVDGTRQERTKRQDGERRREEKM